MQIQKKVGMALGVVAICSLLVMPLTVNSEVGNPLFAGNGPGDGTGNGPGSGYGPGDGTGTGDGPGDGTGNGPGDGDCQAMNDTIKLNYDILLVGNGKGKAKGDRSGSQDRDQDFERKRDGSCQS
jgi:hypothetical protein